MAATPLRTRLLLAGAAALVFLLGIAVDRLLQRPPPKPPVSLREPERLEAPAGWPCKAVFRPGRTSEDELGAPTGDWRFDVLHYPSLQPTAGGVEERVGTAVLATAPGGDQIVYEVRGDTCEEWLNGQRFRPGRCKFEPDMASKPPRIVETCDQVSPTGQVLGKRALSHPLPPFLGGMAPLPGQGSEVSWDVSRSVIAAAGRRSEGTEEAPAPAGWPCTSVPRVMLVPGREETQPVFDGKVDGREFVVTAGRTVVEMFERYPDGFCNQLLQASREPGECEVRLLKPEPTSVAVERRCRTEAGEVRECSVQRLVLRDRLYLEKGRASGGDDPCAALESGPPPESLQIKDPEPLEPHPLH